MSESHKKVTGYAVCQEMVEVLQSEVQAMRAQQRVRARGDSMAGPVRALAQSCAVLQAEIRKTGDDADKAVDNLPPERQFALICRMIDEMSPEHRVALSIYLEERGTKLL
jgi:hypothetical protein